MLRQCTMKLEVHANFNANNKFWCWCHCCYRVHHYGVVSINFPISSLNIAASIAAKGGLLADQGRVAMTFWGFHGSTSLKEVTSCLKRWSHAIAASRMPPRDKRLLMVLCPPFPRLTDVMVASTLVTGCSWAAGAVYLHGEHALLSLVTATIPPGINLAR